MDASLKNTDTSIIHLIRVDASMNAVSEDITWKLVVIRKRGKEPFVFRNLFVSLLTEAVEYIQTQMLNIMGTSLGKHSEDYKEFVNEPEIFQGDDKQQKMGNEIRMLTKIAP